MSAIWFLKCLWCQHWHCDLTCMGIFGLTHWNRAKIDAILQTTFSNGFSWMKMYEFRLTFHWSGPRGPINNIPTLVQIMAWRRPGDKPLSEPMMVRSPTHICVTELNWVKLDGVLLIFRYITERDHYHWRLFENNDWKNPYGNNCCSVEKKNCDHHSDSCQDLEHH